mmetsp:Transcript_24876/g.78712  ORF Transcript_24876/g.78712 Transcript_24876/m.78712 type:complete len:284 (+) Transcript_24876:992-1843(+)
MRELIWTLAMRLIKLRMLPRVAAARARTLIDASASALVSASASASLGAVELSESATSATAPATPSAAATIPMAALCESSRLVSLPSGESISPRIPSDTPRAVSWVSSSISAGAAQMRDTIWVERDRDTVVDTAREVALMEVSRSFLRCFFLEASCSGLYVALPSSPDASRRRRRRPAPAPSPSSPWSVVFSELTRLVRPVTSWRVASTSPLARASSASAALSSTKAETSFSSSSTGHDTETFLYMGEDTAPMASLARSTMVKTSPDSTMPAGRSAPAMSGTGW